MNGLSGYIFVFIGNQKNRCAGDFVRGAGSLHWNLLDEFVPLRFAIMPAYTVGEYAAGRDSVDVYAMTHDFQRQGFRKDGDTRFSRRVTRARGIAGETVDGGDVN